jgi:hypothetical protein
MAKKNRQKWLTDRISGDWRDKDTIIETVLVQCLFDYVEQEMKGELPDRGYYDEDLKAGHVSEGYAEQSYAWNDAIRKVYAYFKTERAVLEKEIDEAFAANEIQRAIKAESDLYERDTEMLSTIVKYRGYLWT